VAAKLIAFYGAVNFSLTNQWVVGYYNPRNINWIYLRILMTGMLPAPDCWNPIHYVVCVIKGEDILNKQDMSNTPGVALKDLRLKEGGKIKLVNGNHRFEATKSLMSKNVNVLRRAKKERAKAATDTSYTPAQLSALDAQITKLEEDIFQSGRWGAVIILEGTVLISWVCDEVLNPSYTETLLAAKEDGMKALYQLAKNVPRIELADSDDNSIGILARQMEYPFSQAALDQCAANSTKFDTKVAPFY
jgi:hypothetical protein